MNDKEESTWTQINRMTEWQLHPELPTPPSVDGTLLEWDKMNPPE